jgi:hypothetical protein
MLLKATKSLGIYPGLYYRVRYIVKNAIGWSEFSDITYILSARRPDTPVPPSITLWQGVNIRVCPLPAIQWWKRDHQGLR